MHISEGPNSLLSQPFLTVVKYHIYGPLNSTVLCFLRENGKKHIGKESQKNLWYLALGTNGQWGCSVILWDGLSICASVFFENSVGREWGHRPRTDMKYHLSTLHWSPGLPRLILSPQSQHSGADPRSLPLPTLPLPPAPKDPMKVRSERRGD